VEIDTGKVYEVLVRIPPDTPAGEPDEMCIAFLGVTLDAEDLAAGALLNQPGAETGREKSLRIIR
jgi:hypothetical protein